MKILIASDAWHPQVNGVVRTLSHVRDELVAGGDEVTIYAGQDRTSIAMPGYSEIRLSFPRRRHVEAVLREERPDAIHIATEGPVGQAMRRACLATNLPFTTSYHTRFPQYLSARLPVPGIERAAYRLLKRFHGAGEAVLVPTKAIADELLAQGFDNVRVWTRGVDHNLFRPPTTPRAAPVLQDEPVLIYVGRVAVEKGIGDFLKAHVAGRKIIVGDGPQRAALEAAYPDATFTGYLFGDGLVQALQQADVFVFPSRTDTFGLVMLEAMACGLPVAAYPVPGPVDVVEHRVSGWLDDDLATAIDNALTLPRQAAMAHAARYTWVETARQFRAALVATTPIARAA